MQISVYLMRKYLICLKKHSIYVHFSLVKFHCEVGKKAYLTVVSRLNVYRMNEKLTLLLCVSGVDVNIIKLKQSSFIVNPTVLQCRSSTIENLTIQIYL